MRMWENGNPYTLLVGMYSGTSTSEKSLAVTLNVNIVTPPKSRHPSVEDAILRGLLSEGIGRALEVLMR